MRQLLEDSLRGAHYIIEVAAAAAALIRGKQHGRLILQQGGSTDRGGVLLRELSLVYRHLEVLQRLLLGKLVHKREGFAILLS